MIVALSGTPGTGKTTVCGILRERYGREFNIIDLNRLIIDEKLHTGKDVERDTLEADMDKLKDRVKQLIDAAPPGTDIILEGHLSHFLPVDAIIVLRANPAALRRRLCARNNYTNAKVKENANAEALDVILVESCQRCEKVFEIDTTEKDAPAVASSVFLIIETLKRGETPRDFLPGNMNWIDLMEL